MKNQLLCAAAFLALAVTSAVAADMPVKAPVYKAPVIVPYNWTGFYVGGNAGYSWGDWDASSNEIIYNSESRTANPKVDGWLVGLQAGYNLQSGAWVFGLEGDIQITGEKGSQGLSDPGAPPIIFNPPDDFLPGPPGAGPAAFTHEWKFPWFGTVRGRLGVLPAERWLLYVTGGLAFGEAEYNMTFSQPGAPPPRRFYALSDSVTKAGWTVGGGVETAFGNNWSVKLEYLYVDLGTRSIDTTDIDGAPFHVEYKIRDNIVRAGLNYRFR
jgi:outer membrane immunogenic protein